MFNQTLTEFITNFSDETLWELADEYEKWETGDIENAILLREKASEFCKCLNIPKQYHLDFMRKIVFEIYKHFAYKWKDLNSQS